MKITDLPFRRVVCVDFEFEFGGVAGSRPRPVCMAAKDLLTGQVWRMWRGEFGSVPPFPVGPETLFVAYFVSAELGCFRALGWPAPARILDPFTEFRNHTNGLKPPLGNGLIGALAYFGCDAIGAHYKREMVELILTGGPWSVAQREAILDYCAGDVLALERLLPAMLPHIDLPRALLRGRYMAAVAAIEFNGTPIDVPTLERLRHRWDDIKGELITTIDADYAVYENGSFKEAKFEAFLVRHNIPWPRLESGRLDLKSDTFRQMAKAYPIVAPLHELRHAFSEMRLNDLAVGEDGRNRTLLSPFGSKTGRNQPSNTKFIFGPSAWLRGLIKPPPGHAVAYIDWSNQEFAIAAKLSGDAKMVAAYESGDPYLAFGKQAGKLPPDATKTSHPAERQLLKQCVLGISYAMGEKTLAARMGQPVIVARELLRLHRDNYRDFWKFAEQAVDHGMLGGSLNTVFGWHLHPGADPNPRSLQNFPMQAHGAEMLRLACCLGIERGIEICAPVHDAILICAPIDRINEDVAAMRAVMAEASCAVLGGFEVRTDVNIVQHPDRYMDERGDVMWQRVMELLGRLQRSAGGSLMVQDADLFNIESLKVDVANVKTNVTAKPANVAKGRFVRLPGEWAHRLCRAKHLSTYKVAIYLLHLYWKSRGKPIRLANAALRSMGVGRDAKWRALFELETLGLVEVSRRERKSPEVILKNL